MKKILITTSTFGEYDQKPLSKLKAAKFEVMFNPYGRKLSEEESKKLYTNDICGVIAGTEEITGGLMAQANSLKVISRCGTGLDNVDLVSAKKNGIKVFNTPDAVSDAVAELTLGLILSSLRSISFCDRLIRQGGWKKPMGNLLQGKTIGIIGLGLIGKKLVEILKPFDCQFIAFDIRPDRTFAKRNKVKIYSLDDVLMKSDIITLHLSYSKDTNNLISFEQFKLMKKNSIIINAARGNIVNEEALYQALKANQIAGAALDVFAQEPYKGKLIELDNIVLTSHIGSYAKEARIKMESEAVENLLKGLKSKA